MKGTRSPGAKGANFSLAGDNQPSLTFIYLYSENFFQLHLVAEISLSRSFYFTSYSYSYSSPFASFSLLYSCLIHCFASASPFSSFLALSAYLPLPYICVLRFHGGVNGLFRLGPTGNQSKLPRGRQQLGQDSLLHTATSLSAVEIGTKRSWDVDKATGV